MTTGVPLFHKSLRPEAEICPIEVKWKSFGAQCVGVKGQQFTHYVNT